MYLGIDVGTSAVKAVLVDEHGNIAASASKSLDVSSPQIGWSEQQPEDWWKATQAAFNELRDNATNAWSAIKAIGLSGQMHGAVCLDKNKHVLRPAILWNDGRSSAQCVELTRRLPSVGDISGAPVMPGFTAPKLMWMQDNEPQTFANVAHVLLPKDYIRLKLTGELATDMCDAAGTTWLDQGARAWSSEICEASGIDVAMLPTLVEGTEASGTLLPNIASELGLPPKLIVAGGGGDAAAGAFGIGAINDGDAFISLGTSGQLFVCGDSYRPSPERATHAYAHCLPNRWFQMAAMLNGASPMSWFASVCDGDVGEMLKAAEASPSGRVPIFLPYLTGERTPHNDAKIRASFHGLDPATTKASMMRSVVDAIAYSFCDAKDALLAKGGRLPSVAAIGGGARSDFVLQTMADAMNISIHRYGGAENGPAIGAARLAMVAAGAGTASEIAIKPPIESTFEPDTKEADRHLERLAQYRALYQTLEPLA